MGHGRKKQPATCGNDMSQCPVDTAVCPRELPWDAMGDEVACHEERTSRLRGMGWDATRGKLDTCEGWHGMPTKARRYIAERPRRPVGDGFP